MREACYAVIIGGLLLLFAMRFGQWLRAGRAADNDVPEGNHAYGPWRWSQDGWYRVCKFCHEWQLGGDDYDGGPR